MAKISVIIPAYNAETTLRTAVESILSQQVPGMEIIIVNDGSTDGSGAILAEYARQGGVTVLHPEQGGSAACARNTGLARAVGRWVLFVDCDDCLLPDAVETLLAAQARTGADIVQGGWQYCDEADTRAALGGSYELRVGASSADIRLTAVVEVAGTGAPNPYAGKHLPHYTSGKVQSVPDDEWATLLGRPVQQGKVKIDRNMTLGELNHSRSPLGWLIWLVLTALLNASYKRGKPDLNVLFQYNMPLRALAKMTSGAISMGMVDGIVMELQGFWIIGLVRVIIEAVKNLVLNAQLEQRLRNS